MSIMTFRVPSIEEVAHPFGPDADNGEFCGMQDERLVADLETPAPIDEEAEVDAGKVELDMDGTGLQALVKWCKDNGRAADQIEAIERLFDKRSAPSQDTVS